MSASQDDLVSSVSNSCELPTLVPNVSQEVVDKLKWNLDTFDLKVSPQLEVCKYAEVPVTLQKSKIDWSNISNKLSDEYVQLHRMVVQSGTYNYLGCRIPVSSNLKIDNWRHMLHGGGYHDLQVCDLLEYGFPVSYEKSVMPHSCSRNHNNAQIGRASSRERV